MDPFQLRKATRSLSDLDAVKKDLAALLMTDSRGTGGRRLYMYTGL